MTDTTHASPTLTVRRTFNAPIERVFTLFTEPAHMERWMGPPGSTVSEMSFDAREGGTYRIGFQSPAYGSMIVAGVVTTYQPPQHIAYTWRWLEGNPNDERETKVRIDFIAHGDATEVVLVHDGFADDASRDRHAMGWNGAFSKIDAAL